MYKLKEHVKKITMIILIYKKKTAQALKKQY